MAKPDSLFEKIFQPKTTERLSCTVAAAGLVGGEILLTAIAGWYGALVIPAIILYSRYRVGHKPA